MNYQYIEQLIERYFDGETSLQEESILRSFFGQEEVPAHLQPYCDLFRVENELAAERPGSDFEARVMSHVERTTVTARRLPLSRRFSPLFKAAACVGVVIGLALTAQHALTMQQPDTTVAPQTTRQAGQAVASEYNAQEYIIDDTITVKQSVNQIP